MRGNLAPPSTKDKKKSSKTKLYGLVIRSWRSFEIVESDRISIYIRSRFGFQNYFKSKWIFFLHKIL